MTIFENDFIKVNTTDKDYDFIVVIENKTNEQICVHYNEPCYNDNYDPILIAPNEWIGLLANEEGRDDIIEEGENSHCSFPDGEYSTTHYSVSLLTTKSV